MASSEAVRMAVRRWPARRPRPAAQATAFQRMTALMRRVIISDRSAESVPFSLCSASMKKLPKVTTWALVLHAVEDLREQLALHAGVNLGGHVLPGLLLDVDDVRVAFFDDRLVRDRQERPALDDDLHDVVRRRSGGRRRSARPRRRDAAGRRGDVTRVTYAWYIDDFGSAERRARAGRPSPARLPVPKAMRRGSFRSCRSCRPCAPRSG